MEKGLREAHGLMVNYRYEPGDIEKNHEAYAQDGTVAASRGVRSLLRPPPKGKSLPLLPDLLPVVTSGMAKDRGGRTPTG